MVINKTGADLTSRLSLSGFHAASRAGVFRYSGENTGAIVSEPGQTVSADGFSAAYPARSITLIVIPHR